MPRGGSKPGERRGGRRPGSANKKTREIADRAIAEGITPLEVMLQAMRQFYDAGQVVEAAAVAKDAAPYIHPRLAPVNDKGKTAESVMFVIEG